MKKNFLSITIISALTLFIVSCKDKAKEATTVEAEAVTEVTPETVYTADAGASTIEWQGFKPTGSHNGTISLESGTLNTTDGKISGGLFTIDMASIVDLDIPADKEGNAKLVGHLKSPDFFDVEKYPTAKFEITGINETEGKTMLSGNLTLKDATNNITFPVSVSQENDSITLASETFTIDRSKWNVKFGSKSFFDDLGDKFINDDIELKIKVKAAKS
ncbi:YceI family protein [Sabulilitoribacter multivorans]|uniref:YceI family protein n=1 Tax=Flaviramulus multivorans TaxID=1304750 RepID=A0ABS9IMK4_9FLAO|nr:YceI family protein [Flaviramulus multivorans]MCF7561810.1 YceI family protein [Flaviramulus multivorans]